MPEQDARKVLKQPHHRSQEWILIGNPCLSVKASSKKGIKLKQKNKLAK
jgi:hypothetical protein